MYLHYRPSSGRYLADAVAKVSNCIYSNNDNSDNNNNINNNNSTNNNNNNNNNINTNDTINNDINNNNNNNNNTNDNKNNDIKFPIPPLQPKSNTSGVKTTNLVNNDNYDIRKNDEEIIINNQNKIKNNNNNYIQSKPAAQIIPPSEHLKLSKKYGDKGRYIRAKLLVGKEIIFLFCLFVSLFIFYLL
jgi:hypothetical protein